MGVSLIQEVDTLGKGFDELGLGLGLGIGLGLGYMMKGLLQCLSKTKTTVKNSFPN